MPHSFLSYYMRGWRGGARLLPLISVDMWFGAWGVNEMVVDCAKVDQPWKDMCS